MSWTEPPPWGSAPPVASGRGVPLQERPRPRPDVPPTSSKPPPSPPGPGAPRVDLEPPRPRMSGCAWMGIAAGLAVFVGIGGFLTAVLVGDDGDSVARSGVAVSDVTVGVCVQVPRTALSSGSLATDSCSVPHAAEVIHVGELDDGAFPGEQAAQRLAAQQCLAAFEPYIGIRYEESRLQVTVTSPTDVRWREGDRSYACIAHPDDGSALPGGSVRGTAR